ncbi:MAG: aminotransferase class I/II-fold pyridoxal phosphate-dependent enzyme [Rhodothermales bacterium]
MREAVRAESVYHVPAHEDISVKLNQNECPFDVPVPVKHLLLQRFASAQWNRYPTEFSDELRSLLAESLGVSTDSLILGNGSNELAQFLGCSLIRPGGSVAVLDPMFSLFEKVVRLCDGVPVKVPCEADYSTDTILLEETIRTSGANLAIVASPNNPTGKAIDVAALGVTADRMDGLLLIDEAYHEFMPGPSALSLLPSHPNVIVMRTFSKTVGLAGLRLGYLVADPVIVSELLKARLPFMINRLTAIVASYLVAHPEIVRERAQVLTTERDGLLTGLRQIPNVDVVPSSTNFLIFRTPLEAGDLQQALARRGVLVRDVSGYKRLPRFVRVNAGLPDENKAFLSALNDVLFAAGGEAL